MKPPSRGRCTQIDVLLATGTAYLPQVIGGLEINTHELAIALNRRGVSTAVLAKLSPKDLFGAGRVVANCWRGAHFSFDLNLGYAVYRSRSPWSHLDQIAAPQIAIVQNGDMFAIANALTRRRVPCFAYFHGLPFETQDLNWRQPSALWPFCGYIANSTYTAARFRSHCGMTAHVIPPLLLAKRYRAEGEKRFATFINPVPEKGVDLAVAIAALCPEISFRFVKAWPLSLIQSRRLRAKIARLRNVDLIESSWDMRLVYSETRVLLVPSQWDAETWGRVASEAQFSGIPILSSDVGGLPEAVGPGGVIIARQAPATAWAAALRALWHSPTNYCEKSRAALLHSQRDAINPDRQLDSLLKIIFCPRPQSRSFAAAEQNG